MIRPVTRQDAEQLSQIYNAYQAQSGGGWERDPLVPSVMAEQIAAWSPRLPWLVYCKQEQPLGYACAMPWRAQPAFRYTVETCVYLDASVRGQNLGTQLYRVLIGQLREQPLHQALAAIPLPNAASIRLHEKLGFRKVAHFNEVGCQGERWINLGYWQLLLVRFAPEEAS
ncbi:N-acetyltransferase family protein [Pseudaeromonas sp. ZJS20]|uniref:GNAT family N-acetyltransferase n=1 Tax=Pseudaeromonas aegiceratis TaxID=3153928 RepID=UPI00390C4CF3